VKIERRIENLRWDATWMQKAAKTKPIKWVEANKKKRMSHFLPRGPFNFFLFFPFSFLLRPINDIRGAIIAELGMTF